MICRTLLANSAATKRTINCRHLYNAAWLGEIPELVDAAGADDASAIGFTGNAADSKLARMRIDSFAAESAV